MALCEKGDIASEASGQSTAAVRVQGRHPHEIPMMLDCIEMWKTLDQELEAPTEFVQGGNLYIAQTEADVQRFERSSAIAQSAGLDSKLLSPVEVYDLLPAMSRSYPVLAGMYSPNDGYAGNYAATRAFARAAAERGASIKRDTIAFRINGSSGQITGVETTDGTISTKRCHCRGRLVTRASAAGRCWSTDPHCQCHLLGDSTGEAVVRTDDQGV